MTDPLSAPVKDPEGATPSPSEVAGGEPSEPSQKQTPPAPPPEIEELRRRLDEHEKRLRDTQTWGNEQHMARLAAEANERAVREAYERDRHAAHRAAQMQPPQIDWEEAISDGNKLRAALDAHQAYGAMVLLNHLEPQLTAARDGAGDRALLHSASRRIALEQAKSEWESSGYDGDTWEQIRPDLEAHLKKPENLAAALQPGGAKAMGWILADRKGLPIQSGGSRERIPPSSSASPSAKQNARVHSELSPMIERLRKQMGFGPDWKPSERELSDLSATLERG